MLVTCWPGLILSVDVAWKDGVFTHVGRLFFYIEIKNTNAHIYKYNQI